ncbi:uncharacterized protein LOC143453091 [Clavelina lepadiformis]|uniref:uncharacterized protein LOC143453091 n=1 Tax=Clavelina lepadiformis TaxID=159417 RepID=UPI004042FC1C
MKQFMLFTLFLLLCNLEKAESQAKRGFCPRQPEKLAEGRTCGTLCSKARPCVKPNVKCRCDGDCGQICLNPLGVCPTLRPIPNGRITYSRRGRKKWRTTGRYRCDDGYAILGAALRVCESDRRWSGEAPVCTDISLALFWNRAGHFFDDIHKLLGLFYAYAYDDPRTPQIAIDDGGGDMYDNGNMVRFYVDGVVPANPLPYNTQHRGLSYHVMVGGTRHPFLMLAWITNRNRARHTYTIDVRSGTGADGNGTIVTYNGKLTEGRSTLEYHTFQIVVTADPTICEVYFNVYNQAVWGSIPGDRFNVKTFSKVTDPVANSVILSGRPRNVLMGYMLLSRPLGIVITQLEIQRTLFSFMQRLRGETRDVEDLFQSIAVNQALTAISQSNPHFQTSYTDWYSYIYDGGTNSIEDGGRNMFDGGNKITIHYNGNPDITEATYGQFYKSINYEFQSVPWDPFISLLWVSNDNNQRLNITFQVTGKSGNDGSVRIFSGNLPFGNFRTTYHVFEISGGTHPTICEVYFSVHNTAEWKSVPAQFRFSRFTTNTHRLDNSVQLLGKPRNIMLGYTLLSRFPTAVVDDREIRVVLNKIIAAITTIDI